MLKIEKELELENFNDVLYGDRGQFIVCDVKDGVKTCNPTSYTNNFDTELTKVPE